MTTAPSIGASQPVPKNRYSAAVRNPDWTISQGWPSYTAGEHDRWNRLFTRQSGLLRGRACEDALESIKRLELSRSVIPDFADLSERLAAITGWRVVAMAGGIPNDAFSEHMVMR